MSKKFSKDYDYYSQPYIYEEISDKIKSIIQENGYDDEVADLILNLYDYMFEKVLMGACHAISSVLYVALSEMGYNPVLCIGECQKQGDKPFDHSWLLIDNKIIDLAIFMPLTDKIGSYGGVVIFGIDIFTLKPTELHYGINSGLPFSDQTIFAMKQSFGEYMQNFPFENDGLWSVLERIYIYEDELDIKKCKKKYKNIERKLVR